MGKLIIFCRHAVETLEYFSSELARAFAGMGFEVFWLDMDMACLSAWKLRQEVHAKEAEKRKEAVLITFNFIGLSGEEGLWEPRPDGMAKESLWEKEGIRCLNILVDHPVYYYEQLQYPLANTQIFCIDRDHAAYMKRFYPGWACEFLPSAGNGMAEMESGLRETIDQWLARPYPLVFTANYVPLDGIKSQLDALEPEYRDFYYEIIEALIRQPEKNLLEVVEAYMRREVPDINDAGLRMAMRTMPVVDLWVRTYFREKTVRILAEGGIKIYLYGKDWERMTCEEPQNLISVSGGRMISSADCVRAAAQAKIALNTMPWFKDGAHDRIFTAMLHGAAALTDDSRYLREQFADYETLIYYDLHALEELPQQVRGLLCEPQRLYEITCRAKAVARQYHTWGQRAESLLRHI